MSELGFSITTRLGDAVRKLGQLATGLTSIGRAAGTVNAQTAGAARSMTVLAAAVSRANGALGGMMGQIGGAMGVGGALGKIAIAVGLATAAWNAFDGANRRAMENVRKQITLQRELADVARRAAASAASAGAGARNQEGGLRRLTALGGSQTDIDRVVARYGVSPTEASQALVALRERGLDEGTAERGLAAADTLRRTGRQGFAEAAAAFAGSVGAQAQPSALGSAALLASAQSGQIVTPGQLTAEAFRTRSSSTLRRFDEVGAIEGQQDLARLRQFEATGVGAARQELANIVDPMGQAMLAWNKALQENIELLKAQAEAQGWVSRQKDNLTFSLGGGPGSFRTQHQTAVRNAAVALGVGE